MFIKDECRIDAGRVRGVNPSPVSTSIPKIPRPETAGLPSHFSKLFSEFLLQVFSKVRYKPKVIDCPALACVRLYHSLSSYNDTLIPLKLRSLFPFPRHAFQPRCLLEYLRRLHRSQSPRRPPRSIHTAEPVYNAPSPPPLSARRRSFENGSSPGSMDQAPISSNPFRAPPTISRHTTNAGVSCAAM